jgi:hypothetical protein
MPVKLMYTSNHRFHPGTTFEDARKFGTNSVFGKNTTFGNFCDFEAGCTFKGVNSFGFGCTFAPGCTIDGYEISIISPISIVTLSNYIKLCAVVLIDGSVYVTSACGWSGPLCNYAAHVKDLFGNVTTKQMEKVLMRSEYLRAGEFFRCFGRSVAFSISLINRLKSTKVIAG